MSKFLCLDETLNGLYLLQRPENFLFSRVLVWDGGGGTPEDDKLNTIMNLRITSFHLYLKNTNIKNILAFCLLIKYPISVCYFVYVNFN